MNLLLFLNILNILIIGLAVLIIFIAIFLNFLESNKINTKKEKRSWVETGTMFIFFFLFYFVIRFNLGRIDFPINNLVLLEIYLAWFVIILGT